MNKAKFYNYDTNEVDIIDIEGQAVYVVEILKPNTHETDSVKAFLSYEDALKAKETTSNTMPVNTFVINALDEITESDSEVYQILPPEEVKKGDTVYIYGAEEFGSTDIIPGGVFNKKLTDENIDKINEDMSDNGGVPFDSISKNWFFETIVE